MQLSRGSGADLETRSPGEPALVFVEGEQFGRIQVERRGDVENVPTAVTAGLRVPVWPITLPGTKWANRGNRCGDSRDRWRRDGRPAHWRERR